MNELYISDAETAAMARTLSAMLGIEETPDGWRDRLPRMIREFQIVEDEAHPEAAPVSESDAWEKMKTMLVSLGAKGL